MNGKELRKVLTVAGFKVDTARKVITMVGGGRYMSARGNMVYSTGTPENHYEIKLRSIPFHERDEPGETLDEWRTRQRLETTDNYLAAAKVLVEAGYESADFSERWSRILLQGDDRKWKWKD
jgi:hypothetical protein